MPGNGDSVEGLFRHQFVRLAGYLTVLRSDIFEGNRFLDAVQRLRDARQL